MKGSSNRFKAIAVSSGIAFWFFIITSASGFFKIEYLVFFVIVVFSLTQIFAKKISHFLDVFGIFNTKIFLGLLYVFVISLYGIFFRILRIDLLRLKKHDGTYWLKMKSGDGEQIFKQY